MKKMYKCSHCDKEFQRVGPRNLHQYHCMIKQTKKEQASNVSRETKAEENEECIHSFRLLNGSIPLEKRAIQSGYMEVCRKCQNVQ